MTSDKNLWHLGPVHALIRNVPFIHSLVKPHVVDGQSLKIDASSGGTIFIGCVIVPQSNKKSLSTTVPSHSSYGGPKNNSYAITLQLFIEALI